jgi:uncharacterized protein (TIGR01319 family)
MHYILATDVGSTTTKARFFSRKNGEWRFVVAGEAPTTVETPYEDVTLGVRNAIREVEELTGHPILFEDGSGIVLPYDGKRGVDLYCTTSSAGGGLQMLVAGVIATMTAQSANRAALGAGAIVVDVVSMDDGRRDFEKIRRIRHIRPDMILLAGGTDDGTVVNVMNIAELINAAGPRPRLGDEFTIPLVYAGNKTIHNEIRNLMKDNFALTIVDNLRPVLEVEHVEPAREAIHEQFMEHVMSHAPGYTKLMKWTDVDIMPTPAGEGMAMRLIAETYNVNVLGVGLGGATTNVYSVIDGRFVRSVSANLGMSYSICNVLKEAGIENIMRWLPFDMSEKDVGNRLMNKMIRPTTIPQTLKELILEHSTAREALRLGLAHHRTIATRLKGVRVERSMADLFEQQMEETYVKMSSIDIIVGTGGLLSHAPLRVQSMMVMVDAFQPEGMTRIFQDSVFMMPHLGVLSTVYKDAAWSIFEKDCLVPVGTVIAPTGTSKTEGDKVMMVDVEMQGKEIVHREVGFGEIECIPLPPGTEAKVTLNPQRGFDLGAGSGHKIEATVMGGVVGLVLDARGRPLELSLDPKTRKRLIVKWINSLNIYEKNALEEITG